MKNVGVDGAPAGGDRADEFTLDTRSINCGGCRDPRMNRIDVQDPLGGVPIQSSRSSAMPDG